MNDDMRNATQGALALYLNEVQPVDGRVQINVSIDELMVLRHLAAATPAVGGEALRKQIAEINVDQDKHPEGNLQYVLIRGFSAMGWSQPTLASNDALDAIAVLAAQPASPLRKTRKNNPLPRKDNK